MGQFLFGLIVGVVLCFIGYHLQNRYESNRFLVYHCLQQDCGYTYESDDVAALNDMVETHLRDYHSIY